MKNNAALKILAFILTFSILSAYPVKVGATSPQKPALGVSGEEKTQQIQL